MIFWAMWPWNLTDDDRAPVLCYFKPCASFRSHWWIQTKVTVRKGPIQVKINYFFSRVALQFDVWPWKRKGTYSMVLQALCIIGEFKLEIQSRNAQFGSNSTILLSHVTLQFDVWPWKTIEHIFCATSSFVHHFIAIGEFNLVIQSGNAQFGSKSMILLAVWPCNRMHDLKKQ